MDPRTQQRSLNVHTSYKFVLGSAVVLILLTAPKTDAEPLSEYLWKQTEAIRNNALSTYFVQGIGNGTLDPSAFGSFVIQDAIYLYKTKRSIDTAVCRAQKGELQDFLRNKSDSFERYYLALFSDWHIKDPMGISVGAACQSYMNYEHRIAATEDTIYMIVAMLPCYKLWPWLGQQLQSKNHGVYTEWRNINFDPHYAGYKSLEAFIDAAYTNQTIKRKKALQIFMRTMQYEYDFFNSVQHAE